jgi:serine phosphatase RsbU (regulator of sigma subunit)
MIAEDDERSLAALDPLVSAWNSPAAGARAGGDWCDVIRLSEHEVAITVGDVSGHGDAAAGMMTVIRASVLRALEHVRVPSAILAVANQMAIDTADGVIVTAIVAILNLQLHTLTFANAGHPPPLLLGGGRQAFLEHPPADVPLGVFALYAAANYVVALPSDALLVLYTDGITEHERDPIRGEIELTAAAQRAYDGPGDDLARSIAMDIFRTGRGHDDAAIMALRMRGLGASM